MLDEIERAMRAQGSGASWPEYVVHPGHLPTEAQERFRAKRLDHATLGRLVPELQAPVRSLLKRMTALEDGPISPLEQKLRVGGASEPIIESARLLRANALNRRLEIESSTQDSAQALYEDLHLRLETHAESQKACTSTPTPAIEIWSGLLQAYTVGATGIDHRGLLFADPLLLLGETCELSDRCRLDWGVARVQ